MLLQHDWRTQECFGETPSFDLLGSNRPEIHSASGGQSMKHTGTVDKRSRQLERWIDGAKFYTVYLNGLRQMWSRSNVLNSLFEAAAHFPPGMCMST